MYAGIRETNVWGMTSLHEATFYLAEIGTDSKGKKQVYICWNHLSIHSFESGQASSSFFEVEYANSGMLWLSGPGSKNNQGICSILHTCRVWRCSGGVLFCLSGSGTTGNRVG